MVVKDKIKRFFQRATSIIQGNVVIALFFFFLTMSLFLGDGKQPFVDAWWALGILMMYGVRYYQRGKLDLIPLPRSIGLAWTALILYYIILIPLSDSPGYSISTTVRLIEAYLVYVMFVTISSESVLNWFMKGLLFVGAVATFASFALLLFPDLAGLLPPMNLLYATYGHNHLADLLLFVFPVAVAQVAKKRSIVSVGLLALFTVGMLLTFARGAWILLVFYLLFLVWKSKNGTTRKAGLSIATATIVVFLAISLISLRDAPSGIPPRGAAQNGSFTDRLIRQIHKPSLLQDGRWEYWRQAIQAIKERPLFGSGPGTFYLESKRLQSRPNSYSWFAHSFPLQITVETGVVGLVIFSALFWSVVRRSQPGPLLWGVGLVLVYSLYEFSLDYSTVWLLVSAGLGVLINQDARYLMRPRVVAGAIVILTLFYAVSMSGMLLLLSNINASIGYFFSSYNAKVALSGIEAHKKEIIRNQQLPPLWQYFHSQNPEVLFGVANLYIHQKKRRVASHLYNLATQLDKQNQEYHQVRIRNLMEGREKVVTGEALYWFATNMVSRGARQRLIKEDFMTPIITDLYTPQIFETVFTPKEADFGIAKLAYVLGLEVLNRDPLMTRRWWLLARDIAPWLGYFHVELAGLEDYVFGDNAAARRLLAYCMDYKEAQKRCRTVTKDGIPPPGSFQAYIQEVSEVLY